MNAHADKASKNKGQAIANSLPSLKSESKSAFRFADNRPEAIAQRELQELANNSLQVSRLGFLQQLASNSPQVSRLRSLQQLANNSPQVKQVAQLRALANAKALSPIQEKIANGVAQLAQVPEEEELIQGKFETVQLQQNKSDSKPRENKTGLPDNLKAGIESLSGMSLDNVKVHYNSAQPAQLNALAYAQGSDIHLAPGQEQHLPHEAWHIVQQAQGRVQPTMQMKDGVPVNDDAGLEREADVMGGRAAAQQRPVTPAYVKALALQHSHHKVAGVESIADTPRGSQNRGARQLMKKAFTFIGFDDPNPMLFTQTARNNGVDDSNRHSCMELGNFLAGSTEILVMGHCDGHTILGLEGKDVAKKMVERGLTNTNVKIILVACRAGMGFIESFHLGLLHELKTNKFNGEVFASQENVTSQLKGAKSGKLVVDEKSASALDQAHGEHIHAQQQAEARANKKKEDPFADLNPFK